MEDPNALDKVPLDAVPALWPAIGLLAGTCLAPELCSPPSLPLLVGLIGLGLALANRVGLSLAALALGLLNAGVRQEAEPRPVPGQPAEVTAVVASHPVRHEDETFFHARVRAWRQGSRVHAGAFDLQVTMPPDAPAAAIGTTIRLRGYLRRSAGFANLAFREPGPWRLRLKSGRLARVESPPGGLAPLAGALRHRAEVALDTTSPDRSGAALVRALALGDRSRLPKSWRQALRRSGLSHLLAVSGLHVALLGGVLMLAASALPRCCRFLLPLTGLALYLLLIGPQPAMLRASLMGLLALGALVLHRPPQGLNALACCVAALVLLDPSIAHRLGFQLSVAATAGILFLAPRFVERWTLVPMALRRPFAITLAAQLATLPWTLPLAGGVHPASPLLNLVAIPYLAGCLLASIGWLAVALASGVASWALPVLDALTLPLEGLARLPPAPAFLLPMAASPAWVLSGTAAAVAAALRPALAARAGLLLGLMAQTGGGAGAPAPLEVVVIDVGQGDALVLRDGRQAILVDGGGWPHGDLGGRVLVPALVALGVHRLDAVVVTHPDRDHCAGLADLVRYLPVAEIWMGPGWSGDACATELLTGPVRRWRVLWRGEVERLGRWRLEVLHPEAGGRDGRNDRSLVLLASALGHRLLLTGDVSRAVERRLARAAPGGLEADMLKVAHHGSKTSTSAALLEAVRPRLALISAGVGNPHGHPHPTVLDRLDAAGVRVLRTDRSGMVRLRLRRTGISIELPGAPRLQAAGIARPGR